jgi:hypothetical protein
MDIPQALSPADREAERYATQFMRAIIVGAIVAIPILWAGMTAALVLGGQSFVDAAGISALPAFFCGPFIGGLFSTTLVREPLEHDEHAPAPSVQIDVHDRAA